MSSKNNGNVYSQVLDAPGLPTTLNQAYAYDNVNRAVIDSPGVMLSLVAPPRSPTLCVTRCPCQ